MRNEASRMKHIIEVNNEQEKIDVTDGYLDLIRYAAETALEYEQIAYSCEINIEISDNKAIKAINCEFRGKDAVTDVLSFPMIDAEKLPRLRELIDDGYFWEDTNPEFNTVLLGDIVISAEKAMEQSIEFNQSFGRELAFLTIHSVLHLLGYDHELSDEDDIVMRKKQREILDLLTSFAD